MTGTQWGRSIVLTLLLQISFNADLLGGENLAELISSE